MSITNSFINNIFKGIKNKVNSSLNNPYKKVNLNWIKLKRLKHLPPGKLYVHHLSGGTISFLNAQELFHGLKEIFIDEIYCQKLPKVPYIIDCGANIGLSVIYFKQKYPDAEIVAFEPDEQNFELLTKNVSSFNLKKIELRKEAVWTSDTNLNFSNNGSMGSRLETNNDDSNVPHNLSLVKAIRLKDLINKKIDFLKIDIEGAEYEVLQDISENLNWVSSLFLEYHGAFSENIELNHILSIITQAGFSYYIKEAASIYDTPFYRTNKKMQYDVQLNIFCFKENI